MWIMLCINHQGYNNNQLVFSAFLLVGVMKLYPWPKMEQGLYIEGMFWLYSLYLAESKISTAGPDFELHVLGEKGLLHSSVPLIRSMLTWPPRGLLLIHLKWPQVNQRGVVRANSSVKSTKCSNITLFTSITMLCGTNNIPQKIPHIERERGKYSMEYCYSHITMLWIWIMLWNFGLHGTSWLFLCWMKERYAHTW